MTKGTSILACADLSGNDIVALGGLALVGVVLVVNALLVLFHD